jgi:hypothetical protein
MAEYPQRDSHFAHRLIRLMIRTCAAQEIGTEGFMLVCIIAHTEDAKHYAAPVTFWNDQLLSVCGFASWGKLDRARKKAKSAGWLHYEEGGKGKVGRYWATVPKAFRDQPDNSAECDYPLHFLSESGEETEGEPGDKRGTNEGEPGDKRGANGEHSTLSLSLSLLKDISSEPQAAPEPVTNAVFPVVGSGSKTWALPQRVYDVLSKAYPTLPLDSEIGKAVAWCETNPTKRKTARGMPKFLNAWMERAQNNGASRSRAGPVDASAGGESMAEFVRRARAME